MNGWLGSITAPVIGNSLRATFASIVVVLALGAGPSSLDRAQSPPTRLAVDDGMRRSLKSFSTGAMQDMVVSGTDARQRNALIPISAGRLAAVPSFTEIPATSSQYQAALKCLTQAIYYEAANEPEGGKRAVAQVVLNRLRHPEYPNSVCGVVYEGVNAPVCQFSFTCDGSLLRPPLARQWGLARQIAKEALAGRVAAEVGSATHYHADYVLPRWAFTLGKLAKVGTHIFYRFPGKVGTAAALIDRWAGRESIPSLDFVRLRDKLEDQQTNEVEPQEHFVPGLSVVPDVKDRHAAQDLGGRLDTRTGWRLTLPDPVYLSASYRSALSDQGVGPTESAGPATEVHAEDEAPVEQFE